MNEDIKEIKNSLCEYQELLNKEENLKSDKWYSLINKTGWLLHIQSAINTANLLLESFKAGKTILVHSELGKDRVALISSLALALFDPYYRTMKGFEVLIEREFISFGHQFRTRLANCQENGMNRKDYVPIFLLLLDCIYQTMIQAPLAFEFNQRFLKKLAVHSQTLKFGTFLNNNDIERDAWNTRLGTISIWRYIEYYKKDKYLNKLYDRELSISPLNVNPIPSKLVVWTSLYLRWIPPTVISKEDYPNEM